MDYESSDYRELLNDTRSELDEFSPEDADLDPREIWRDQDYFERNLELGYWGDCNQLEQLAEENTYERLSRC